MSIGKRIKLCRENLSYTQEDLARKVLITRSTIMAYELGLQEPKEEILAKLAGALKVSVNYLLGQYS